MNKETIKEFIEKYMPSEISTEVQHLCGLDITEEMCEGFNKQFLKDLDFILQQAKDESQQEKRVLIMWLKNLTHKIMRFDEFKGLRGYPITHFIEKYQSNKK